MTVSERPVINLLTFQAWDRDAGAWTDLADRATNVDIQRGATQSGAKVETQVGTLEAQLYGPLDLRRVSDLQPNSPIRVIRPPLPPALAWDLMPATAADAIASKGLFPRNIAVEVNGNDETLGFGAGAFSDQVQANWNNRTPDTTVVPAGTILMTSPNTYAANPTNPKPVGKFDGGEPYTVRGFLDLTDAAVNPRLRVVIYTGTASNPTVLAQSDPITPIAVWPYTEIDWTFTAPDDDDWNIGIASVDTQTVNTDRAIFNFTIMQLAIWDNGRQRPEFTGAISDIFQSVEYDKSTNQKHTYTTVQAVDSVQSLANTDRYGVIASSGAGYQTWADRIQQLSEAALVPIDAPVDGDTVFYDQSVGVNGGGWDQYGVVSPSNQWYAGGDGKGGYSVYHLGSSTVAGTVSGIRVAQILRGLDRGAGYAAVLTVTVTRRTNVTGDSFKVAYRNGGAGTFTYGDTIDMTTSQPQTLAVRFVPTAKSGSVGFFQQTDATLGAGASTALTITIRDMRVIKVGQPDAYALQDVGYESSLLNHFDLACNSVGARWYVTKRGVVLFRRSEEDAEPGARFSDTDTGDVSYTDVALGYDTRNVVNSLKLNQHGYDPATGNTADESITFTQDSSIARWGARASEIDTCLYLGAPHTDDAAQRAREVMTPLRRPRYTVQQITFNAQSKIDVLDALELRSTIAIDYEDLHQQSRVLAIRHVITPTQWMVTVDVNETHVGARFRDLADVGHTSFAALNATYRGQTFRDFNANPLR
jgi:hypothetical protein